MSNPSKQRGTTFESAVVAYLVAHGFPFAERRALAGSADKGDISGVPGFVIECKATKTLDLAGAVDEATVERLNAGAAYAVAVLKRRGKPTRQSYVVMDLEQFVELVR